MQIYVDKLTVYEALEGEGRCAERPRDFVNGEAMIIRALVSCHYYD